MPAKRTPADEIAARNAKLDTQIAALRERLDDLDVAHRGAVQAGAAGYEKADQLRRQASQGGHDTDTWRRLHAQADTESRLAANAYGVAGEYRREAYKVEERIERLEFAKTTRPLKRAALLSALQDQGAYPDSLTANADGSYSFKRTFFYTHGQSAQGYAEKVKLALPDAVILEAVDVWNTYPKTSYFLVRFYLPAQAAQ